MINNISVIYPDEHIFNFSIISDATMDTPDNHSYILERVFDEWNAGSGVECKQFIDAKVRSLSVNDIVVVNGQYYQCASFGWNKVTSEYVRQLESDVALHPERFNPDFSCYCILTEIMWKREIDNKSAAAI